MNLIMPSPVHPALTSYLSDKTKAVLMGVLGVSKLEDVLYKDFQDISVSCDVIRKQAELYSDRNRGSVRLNAGRYYTAGEFQERVQQAKFIPLP